jgi:hypothetical protein
MGGKKKGGKGKKGAKDGDEKYDVAQMNLILQAQVQSFKERLVLEQERKDRAKAKVEEIRQDEIETFKALETQNKDTYHIVHEMTE